MEKYLKIKTFGQLKASGYESKSIKEELRANLIVKLAKKEKIFDSIKAFDETVIPDIEERYFLVTIFFCWDCVVRQKRV